MKRLIAVCLLCLLAVQGLYAAGPARAGVFDPKDYIEVVVETDATVDPEAYASFFLQQLGVDAMSFETQRVSHVYKYAITGFSVYLTEAEFAKAQRLDLLGVESITKSEKVSVNPITNDVDGQIPEGRVADGAQVIPTGIQRIGALPNGKDYSSVDVAVIDTGVDRKHPDLNVVGGIDCVSALGDQPDYGFDGYGHGTHVAGTIGARDNGLGVVGVAPGARIWSVKVLGNDGSGSYASVICGLDWVAENAATIEVANMSLGGGGYPSACGDGTDPMHDAICAVTDTVPVIVAAGNASADASGSSPANYKEVVTVSAFADFDGQPGGAGIPPQDRCYGYSVDDELAAYSNYGADVDISAPGTCILSTLPTSINEYGVAVPNYGTISGTSMATPMVTGCFARFLSDNPDQREFAREQILTYSESKTDPIPGDHDMIHEPLLYCDAVPRHEASGKEFNG